MEQISIFDLDADLPLYKIDRNKPIRLISLFSGYDSQMLAFKYLGIDVEHYRTVEFNKYAVQSLNDIHNTNFSVQDITKINGDYLGVEDTDKYTYVMTYSAPCTDISLAGKRAGMSKESGTRSANIWEVGRLLHECKELPQILIMENVPEIVNECSWKNWVLLLENLGYSSYCQFLNAKNYGIPQNRERCFMVSILGNYNYNFPKGFELKYRLKDLLENNVDESFCLSDKFLNYCLGVNQKKSKFPRKKRFLQSLQMTNEKGIATTISTNAGNRPVDNFINCGNKRLAKTLQDNDIEPNSYIDTYNNRKDGCSGTITTGVDFRNYSFVAVSNDKPNIIGKYVKGGFSAGQIVDKESIAPTFMENHGKVMGIIDYKSSAKYQNKMENKNVIPTLYAQEHYGIIENLRIRKLTPKECFKLMGVKPSDYDKLTVSKTQKYIQAGNSIVTTCLMAIYSQLFNGVDYRKKIDELLENLK